MDFAYDAKSTGFDYEKRVAQGFNFGQVAQQADVGNIFGLLCDFNGDGQLSVNYYEYQTRKTHQEKRRAQHPNQVNNRRELWLKDWNTEKQ